MPGAGLGAQNSGMGQDQQGQTGSDPMIQHGNKQGRGD